jgi:hypothetical protein
MEEALSYNGSQVRFKPDKLAAHYAALDNAACDGIPEEIISHDLIYSLSPLLNIETGKSDRFLLAMQRVIIFFTYGAIVHNAYSSNGSAISKPSARKDLEDIAELSHALHRKISKLNDLALTRFTEATQLETLRSDRKTGPANLKQCLKALELLSRGVGLCLTEYSKEEFSIAYKSSKITIEQSDEDIIFYGAEDKVVGRKRLLITDPSKTEPIGWLRTAPLLNETRGGNCHEIRQPLIQFVCNLINSNCARQYKIDPPKLVESTFSKTYLAIGVKSVCGRMTSGEPTIEKQTLATQILLDEIYLIPGDKSTAVAGTVIRTLPTEWEKRPGGTFERSMVYQGFKQ